MVFPQQFPDVGGRDDQLVAEHAPAHQLPDAGAYQRGSHCAKRAALMAEWAVYCATAPTDAVVKPIRGAA